MNDRTNLILEILTEEKKIQVSDLAKRLSVSEVTVRKDLDLLENRGILKREHGYALLLSEEDLNGRLAYHYAGKRAIAKKAAELVKEGDTVMIESGSCCALLAEELIQTHKNLTIITNSSFIATYIRNKGNATVILLGGIYQKEAQVNVGPLVKQCVMNFLADLLFIGVDGYDRKAGFTNRDPLRAEAVRAMAEQCEKIVILTESEKFSQRGSVPLHIEGKEQILISDHHLSEDIKKDLIDKKVSVLTT